MNTKKELRSRYRALRSQLSAEERDKASLAITNHLLKIPIWDCEYYHIFLQIAEQMEVDTSYVITLLQGRDKEIVIPRVCGPMALEHILLTDNTRIRKNKWNIPEPENGLEVPVSRIEVVFVPLLAFDRQGHRVGYGGGFYDKFLSECGPGTIKVGLSFFEPLDEISERESHDIPLDFGVTPKATYAFSS